MDINMNSEEMWQAFTAEKKVNAKYQAWAFCGGGEVGDCLARLVLQGIKTATASSYVAYTSVGEAIPEVGDYSVILFDRGEAACIIQTKKVTLKPFCEVSAEHAYLEGEGDRSLSYWREVHREAFSPDYGAAGLPFDEKGLCVLEEFEIAYKP